MLVAVSGALYWLAAAMMWAVVAGTANAWVLIVEVARDVRYLPLDDHEAERSPATAQHPDNDGR
jgi:hypothetical protein